MIVGLVVGLVVMFIVYVIGNLFGFYEGFWGLLFNLFVVVILNLIFLVKIKVVNNGVKEILFFKSIL